LLPKLSSEQPAPLYIEDIICRSAQIGWGYELRRPLKKMQKFMQIVSQLAYQLFCNPMNASRTGSEKFSV